MVVEDEVRLATLVSGYLGDLDMTCEIHHDGVNGLAAAAGDDVDVVVLDRMLPGMDGIDVCRKLRGLGHEVPVLMLTARGSIAERVEGLEAGADDYLVKPFALEELAARVRVLGRRRPAGSDHRWSVCDVVFDDLERRVWIAGDEVTLGRREFDALAAFVENFGRVVTRQRLFDQLWPESEPARARIELVRRLRERARQLRTRGLDQPGGEDDYADESTELTVRLPAYVDEERR